MVRSSRGAFLALFAAVLSSGPAVADAAGSPVRVCQEAVARAGAGLVDKVVRLEQACLRKVARGRLPVDTRCVGLGGDVSTVTPAVVRAALQRAIDGAGAVMREKCATIDLFAPPPDGLGMPGTCRAIHESCAFPLNGFDAAIACQVCAHVSAAQYTLAIQYPGAEATPDPNRTPTPTPTKTPGGPGGPTVVAFDVQALTRISGFKFHVGYPGAKGSFRGTADAVQCLTDTGFGFFIGNHQANQDNLITLLATAGVLGLPSTIACTFDVAAGQVITPDDFTIIVDEVTTDGGSVGDPNDLVIGTSFSTRTFPCLGGNATVAVSVNGSYADLALTLHYPPDVVRVLAFGPNGSWVGVGPLGTSAAEDVDTGADGVADAVRITFSSNDLQSPGTFAEVHFDCLDFGLETTDTASFPCDVDLATDLGGGEVAATCAVTRIGFTSALP